MKAARLAESSSIAPTYLILAILWGFVGGSVSSEGASHVHIRISEFCASNVDTIADEDGDYPDWIEIENPTEGSIDLRAYFLTDDPLQPNKYRLPSYPLRAGERALIFASGKTRERSRPPFHAPFKLRTKGEYLALIERSSGTILMEFSPNYPKQSPGFSYGLVPIPESEGDEENAPLYDYLKAPTPGTPNAPSGVAIVIPTPSFSHERGFLQSPVHVTLSTTTAGAVIRFTTDASTPSADSGTLYTAPIKVDQTQVVRAIAIKDESTSNVATHSYLFPSQIVQQTSPSGFPSRWGDIPADYEMDPRITKDPEHKKLLIPALHSLPTISIATNNDHLFGAERGIYANPSEQGIEWERPASMEWIESDRRTHQIDSGLRIQGGWFRGATVSRKHSFRLLFKRKYGKANLNHDIFNEFGATDKFESLILRAGGNDGFTWSDANGNAQFIRDEFGRRVVLAMGQPAPRGRFVHLYLNGLYWGLYNLCERPNEDFSADYLGGPAVEWDSINTGIAKNGSLTAWSNLKTKIKQVSNLANYYSIQGKDPHGKRQETLEQALNIDHYADYLLANMWLGNADWPDKNYWIGWYRGPHSPGIQFYPWDLEITMGNSRARSPLQIQSPRENVVRSGVTLPHSSLRNIPEYQLNFADRVQKHLVDSGDLSAPSMRARYVHWANQIELAVLTESARWGDDQSPDFRTQSEWKKERDWILDTYIPQRGGIVIEQLRKSGLYPRIQAPLIIPSHGVLQPETQLSIASTEKEVYYTTDGSDPRLPGGELRPTSTKFQGDRTDSFAQEHTLIGEKSVWRYASTGQITKTGWHPETLSETIKWKAGLAPLGVGTKKIQTTMAINLSDAESANPQPYILKKTFALPRPIPISQLSIWINCSDAVSVFLNGEILYRSNQLRGRDTPYSHAERELSVTIDVTIPALGHLRQGHNELVAFVHQRDKLDTITHFDLKLIGTTSPRYKNVTTGAITHPLFGTLKARARTDGRWSALTELDFTVGSPPPSAQHFGISEISFNPSPPSNNNERLVTRESTDFEYVKLTNSSSESYNLSGVKITSGIEYEFPRLTIIGAQESIYIGRNTTAFRARFGKDKKIIGQFKGKLNNGGEHLRTVTPEGDTLDSFTYGSSDVWPVRAEEPGYILERHATPELPNGNLPSSWIRKAEPIKKEPR